MEGGRHGQSCQSSSTWQANMHNYDNFSWIFNIILFSKSPQALLSSGFLTQDTVSYVSKQIFPILVEPSALHTVFRESGFYANVVLTVQFLVPLLIHNSNPCFPHNWLTWHQSIYKLFFFWNMRLAGRLFSIPDGGWARPVNF